jgi:uncharacterized DUF497 family protein
LVQRYSSQTFIAAAARLDETLGRLDGRVHVLWFCETEDGIRIISFRKANSREVKRYEKVETAG